MAKVATKKLVPSYKLNDILSCTTTERRKWLKKGYLVPTLYKSISKYGQTLSVPWFDPEHLKQITPEIIAKWRAEEKEEESINRLVGSIAAKKTRQINENSVKEFYKGYENLLEYWKMEGDLYFLTYRLVYWTTWVSRWAKKYQLSEMNLSVEKERMYQLKNSASELLHKSGICSLCFFEPSRPHKEHIWMCPEHWDGIDSIDEEIAKKCKKCTYSVEEHYFSLYFQELVDVHSGMRMSFHTPYPIGEKFFPSYEKVKKVEHFEQDGMFRFGRPLHDDEKIVFSIKRVLKEFSTSYKELSDYLEKTVKDTI